MHSYIPHAFCSLWRIPNPLRTANFVVRLRIHFVNAKYFRNRSKQKKRAITGCYISDNCPNVILPLFVFFALARFLALEGKHLCYAWQLHSLASPFSLGDTLHTQISFSPTLPHILHSAPLPSESFYPVNY